MNNRHLFLQKRTLLRLSLVIAGFFLVLCFVFSPNAAYADAQNEPAVLVSSSDLPPVYAERGVPFSFESLPSENNIAADLPSGSRESLTAFIEWEITDSDRADAAAEGDFSVHGRYTAAETEDGDSYSLSGELDVEARVVFTDRTVTNGFSVRLRPYYQRNSDTVVMVDVFLIVKGRFSADALHALEYSFGDGFLTLNAPLAWDYTKNEDGTAEFSSYLSFVNEFIAGPDEIAFTTEELSNMLNSRIYFRLKTTGGLFEGYSNTVAILDGEPAPEDSGNDSDDESGILTPKDPSTGSKGGGISFWTTASGTATAVVICIVAVILSIGCGYMICLLLSKRRSKKKQSGDAHD